MQDRERQMGVFSRVFIDIGNPLILDGKIKLTAQRIIGGAKLEVKYLETGGKEEVHVDPRENALPTWITPDYGIKFVASSGKRQGIFELMTTTPPEISYQVKKPPEQIF